MIIQSYNIIYKQKILNIIGNMKRSAIIPLIIMIKFWYMLANNGQKQKPLAVYTLTTLFYKYIYMSTLTSNQS